VKQVSYCHCCNLHVKCGKCQDIAEWVNRRGFCLVDDGLFLSPSSKIQTMPAQPDNKRLLKSRYLENSGMSYMLNSKKDSDRIKSSKCHLNSI